MFYRKTSTTAYMIADSLAKLSQAPRWQGYFPEDMGRLNRLFAQYARDTATKHLLWALPLPLSVFLMDRLYIPGMIHHYLFRKLYIQRQLERAVAGGVQQVIVLGAGLDTLAMRMAKAYPSVRFIEIDLPHTQHLKIHALEQSAYAVPGNCVFKPADLAQEELAAVLASEPSFTPDAATLVVVEGVLMYLSEPEVKKLFTNLHRLFGGPLTILFGAMHVPDQQGSWSVRMVDAFLHRLQETTKWHCLSSGMPAFMAELGYEVREWISYKELQRPYRSAGEISHVPEEDENYYIVTKKQQS